MAVAVFQHHYKHRQQVVFRLDHSLLTPGQICKQTWTLQARSASKLNFVALLWAPFLGTHTFRSPQCPVNEHLLKCLAILPKLKKKKKLALCGHFTQNYFSFTLKHLAEYTSRNVTFHLSALSLAAGLPRMITSAGESSEVVEPNKRSYLRTLSKGII